MSRHDMVPQLLGKKREKTREKEKEEKKKQGKKGGDSRITNIEVLPSLE